MPWLKSMTGKGLKRTFTFLARWALLAVMGQSALLVIFAKFLQCSIMPKGFHHHEQETYHQKYGSKPVRFWAVIATWTNFGHWFFHNQVPILDRVERQSQPYL
jgi:hypothetical protein